MFILGEILLLEILSLYFIFVGVDNLPFDLSEDSLGIISDMDENRYFIGGVEVSDDSDFDSVCFVE